MASEIDRAEDDGVESECVRRSVDSASTGFPSYPPTESTQNSLRGAKSLPSKLQSGDQALAVKTSTALRLVSPGGFKSFLKKFTGRRDQRLPANLETSRDGVSQYVSVNDEETFRCTFPWLDAHKVHGFEEELQALESFVRRYNEGGFRAVAVVGAGGIGKTTLCQLLFDEEGIKEDFAPRIWVSNSRLPNEDKDLKVAIVRRMLTQIGEDETDNMGLDRLMALLYRNLWGKKYLIVLDDARDADRWYYNLGAVPNMEDAWKNRLAYGLPKGSGGRVVVTGRNEEVARKMVGEHNLHKVLPLSDPEYCWSIFKESVGPELDEAMQKTPMNVEALKGEVYAKSAGIPLAVKIMGQIKKEQLSDNGSETA